MTPYALSAFQPMQGWNGSLQFVDEAHAEFYDLGTRALAGLPVAYVKARRLRDRMVPYMDLTDAHQGGDHIANMGGRERAELRRSGFVAVRRFVAWAMAYAHEANDEAAWGTNETGSVYDPDRLLDVLIDQARARAGARRLI